jgi:hypothetical protein
MTHAAVEPEVSRVYQCPSVILDEIGARAGDTVVDRKGCHPAVGKLHGLGQVDKAVLAVFVGAQVGTEDEIGHAVFWTGAELGLLDGPENGGRNRRGI